MRSRAWQRLLAQTVVMSAAADGLGVARTGASAVGGGTVGAETLMHKIACSRCANVLYVPPRLKRRGLSDKEVIKCSSCGHVFMAQFEQPATDARSAAPSGATGEETSIGGTVGYMAPELEAVDRAIRKGVRETRHSNLEGRSVATTPMPAAHSRMARIPNGPGSDLRR